jgi:prepilin-type N-terminal cleavage/methylation domain-containing protein
MRRSHRIAPRAAAFTLLEVILALAVLGGALAIFGEVMHIANRNALDAQAETQAQVLAESVMDEVLAGLIDASNASRQPLETDDAANWLYSITVGTTDVEGVLPLEIVVEQDLEPRLNPVKFRLVRWIPSAAETDENAEEAAAAAQQAAQSSSPAGGSAGGGAGGGGAP